MDKSIPDVHFTPKAPSPEAAIILKYSVWYGKLLHNSAPGTTHHPFDQEVLIAS